MRRWFSSGVVVPGCRTREFKYPVYLLRETSARLTVKYVWLVASCALPLV